MSTSRGAKYVNVDGGRWGIGVRIYRSMRVLHCLWSADVGGAERAMWQLVAAQREEGAVHPGVLLGRGGGSYVDRIRAIGAEVIELGMGSAMDPRVLTRARRAMHGWDVHHFHAMEPGLMAASLATTGSARVFTNRGGTSREDWTPRQRLRHRLGGRLLRRFDALSANTRHAAGVAARRYGLPAESFALTPNGIDFALLDVRRPRQEVLRDLGIDPSGFVVGTTAVLRPLKRVERLLRAAAGVADVRWVVLVVGDGPDRGRLEAEAATLGIAERVRFTGTLERVADHVAAMDLFAMTSGSRESFGNALVEAMALGVPSAVFTDSPGPREHVTDGETGFVLTGEADLADAIRRVAGDPEAAARVGRAGAADVRARYSLEAMLRAYAGLYERARARTDSP